MSNYTQEEVIDILLDFYPDSKEGEEALIDNILSTTIYTDKEDYISHNLTEEVCWDKLEQIDDFTEEVLYRDLIDFKKLDLSELNAKDLAYRYVFELPEEASIMLLELQYYKGKGQIQ